MPKIITCNHEYFANIDSDEKAYWLGFIFADGCISGDYLRIVLGAKDVETMPGVSL